MSQKVYDKQKKLLHMGFVFSLIWSVGASFYDRHRDAFDQQIRKVLVNSNIPHSDNVYGFYIDPESESFMPWMDLAPEFM
jgi:hypothetical protein